MTQLYKYPHTPYLPWSPSIDSDDPIIDVTNFYDRRVVVTEKMDGEGITMYRDAIHARSLDDDGHVSKDWVKNYWSQRRYYIPEDIRICGECLYIKHSIYYDNLEDYFLGFSAWRGDLCLSWKDTLTIFQDCGIISVPMIYEGEYNERVLKSWAYFAMNFDRQEGIVIRLADMFYLDDFERSIAKFVRPKHVQTSAIHWKYATLTKNKLKGLDLNAD